MLLLLMRILQSTTNIPQKINNSSGRKAMALLLIVLGCLHLTLRQSALVAETTSSNYMRISNSRQAKHTSVSTTNVVDAVSTINNEAVIEKGSAITNQQLPIYLLQPDTNEVSQTTWGDLITKWNRTAQYTDLIEFAKPFPSLPPVQDGKRPVVMIHCGPKSGSTTLRAACRTNLEKTCEGLEIPKRLPIGYMNATELYPLIRSCPNTNHFCTKETVMPMDIPAFDDTTFIHMFPFRNYDEWAASALKQAFDRGSDGCRKAEELIDKCTPSPMEIDFRKYGKTDLANYKDLAVRRMNELGEMHIFILYCHRDLDKVLSMLSSAYEIPLLPGSDGNGKSERPKGTCDDNVLQKYHDCFSSQLMELE